MIESRPFKTNQPQYVLPSKTNQYWNVLIYPYQETLNNLNKHIKRLELGKLKKRNAD